MLSPALIHTIHMVRAQASSLSLSPQAVLFLAANCQVRPPGLSRLPDPGPLPLEPQRASVSQRVRLRAHNANDPHIGGPFGTDDDDARLPAELMTRER